MFFELTNFLNEKLTFSRVIPVLFSNILIHFSVCGIKLCNAWENIGWISANEFIAGFVTSGSFINLKIK